MFPSMNCFIIRKGFLFSSTTLLFYPFTTKETFSGLYEKQLFFSYNNLIQPDDIYSI